MRSSSEVLNRSPKICLRAEIAFSFIRTVYHGAASAPSRSATPNGTNEPPAGALPEGKEEGGDHAVELGRPLEHRDVPGVRDDLEHGAADVRGEILGVPERRQPVVVADDDQGGYVDPRQPVPDVVGIARTEIGGEGRGFRGEDVLGNILAQQRSGRPRHHPFDELRGEIPEPAGDPVEDRGTYLELRSRPGQNQPLESV